jgi:hypothetical protein
MKSRAAIFALLAAASVFATASPQLEPLPSPWFMAGESPQLYVAGVDRSASNYEAGAKYMASKGDNGKSWASVMRMVDATEYRGRRIQFSARVKTHGVSGWAGLWMRVDGYNGTDYAGGRPNMMAFYNSMDKPIVGTKDWQLRTVTLEVPQNARGVALGVIQAGTGEVWIDEVSLKAVGSDVPVDEQKASPPPKEAVE